MNAPPAFSPREPIKLTVSSFRLLRGFGAFDDYWKAELLDGELWGVPAEGHGEPESDATFPIKLTIEFYELLARAGAFEKHRKTELLDGRVYAMSPQYRPHGFVKDELAYRLRRALEDAGSALSVATEQSMAIPHFNEPQPDIMLTSEPSGQGAIPVASVALVVEVSDSTSRSDLKQKAMMYAVAEVAEYWVADVTKRVIRQMWRPERGVYAERRELAFGERIAAETITGLLIETSKI